MRRRWLLCRHNLRWIVDKLERIGLGFIKTAPFVFLCVMRKSIDGSIGFRIISLRAVDDFNHSAKR